MALVDIGRLYYPDRIRDAFGGGTAGASITYDSDTDVVAYIGSMPYADTIETVYWRTGTITTGATLNVSVESLTNGRPSGSLIAAGATVSVIVANGDDNVLKTATMGTPPTLAAGDDFAITWRVDTAGDTPAGSFFAAGVATLLPMRASMIPTVAQDTGGGTYTYPALPMCAVIELGTKGVVPFAGLVPLDLTVTATAYNSGTSPDERALKLVVPFKCRAVGICIFMSNNVAGADFTGTLWPESSTTDGDALGQASYDGDQPLATTDDAYVEFYFAPVTLEAGDIVYLGLRADTANNITTLSYPNVAVTGAMKAWGVSGTCHLATRTWTAGTAGAWTESATTTYQDAHLIIDQLDDGAGAGGGAPYHGAMAGGML